ncbi:pilus assembly protein CpaE [Nitrosomonas nitrosa]|uniref:Pilus assembly protein CpaE n=1 Tax=Nitrosomonas nitrosa TaxID=52442 RepID=A0A1I4UUA8_9PROT|nr:AAA family ATPase [Nitrosomonas nitrosa]SFM92577.1 pilus assembly protein CpaE [Nitrosomonas nitrosa]
MKIATIAQDPQCLNDIQKYLADACASTPMVAITGGAQQIPAVIEQEHPDLLLLEGIKLNPGEQQILSIVTSHFPDLGVIMLCPPQPQEFLLEAMRVGIREIVPTPLNQHVLIDAVERFRQIKALAKAPLHDGQVLAFIPCKGGSGATFLASNIAYSLAAIESKRVILIDFNLQLGDASLFVQDSTPTTSIADVTRQIQRLDGSFLSSSSIHVLPNFDVLAAPEEPEKAAEIKPEHVKSLIQVAKKHYDFVILDIGCSFDAISIQCLDHADLIFPVLQQTLPFIRNAKRVIDTFYSLGYPANKIRLILNRFGKKDDITVTDVTNTLNLNVFKTVPNDYSVVAESVNQGIPVIKLARRSIVAKSLQEITRELTQGNEQNGLLKKLFSFQIS